MKAAASKPHDLRQQTGSRAANPQDWRLERLIGRLPPRIRATVRWLRRPPAVWIRWPAGTLLICGGLLGFLPILGFWMLPLGLMLLADDVAPLRSLRSRILDWIELRRPYWLID
jgi:hypothetical protein